MKQYITRNWLALLLIAVLVLSLGRALSAQPMPPIYYPMPPIYYPPVYSPMPPVAVPRPLPPGTPNISPRMVWQGIGILGHTFFNTAPIGMCYTVVYAGGHYGCFRTSSECFYMAARFRGGKCRLVNAW
jgi:hypothetical protein